jgi:hypothetical protein
MATLKAIDFGDSSSRGYFYDDTITTDILNTKQGTISVWYKRPTGDTASNLVTLLNSSDKGIVFGFNTSQIFTFEQSFSSGVYELELTTNDGWPSDWVHVVISWNRTTDTFLYRINGSTLDTHGQTPTWTRTYGGGASSSSTDITNQDHIVINAANSSQTYGQSQGGFSQILFDNKFYDLTDSAVLSKFYSGGAVQMGTSGTTSGLTAPLLYFYGDTAATFKVNNGDTASTHRITNFTAVTVNSADITTVTGPTIPPITASAALTSAFTQTAGGARLQPDEYVIEDYWNHEYTEEIPNRFGAAALTATATQTVSGGLRKDGTASLTSTASLTAIGGLRKDGTASLTSTASLTAVGGLRKDGASALTSSATVSVSAEVGKTGSAALTASATLSASAARRFNATSALSATASLSSGSTIAKFASASLTTAATVTTNGGLSIVGASALTATATQTVSGARAKVGSAALTSTATQSAVGSRRFNAVSGLNAAATMTVSGQDFDIATANLTSAFTLTADADTQFSVTVALSSAFAMTTVAEMLQQANVERTIAVKSETRIIKALQDQRIIPVNSESRINIVLADSRTILVPDETRILKEP